MYDSADCQAIPECADRRRMKAPGTSTALRSVGLLYVLWTAPASATCLCLLVTKPNENNGLIDNSDHGPGDQEDLLRHPNLDPDDQGNGLRRGSRRLWNQDTCSQEFNPISAHLEPGFAPAKTVGENGDCVASPLSGSPERG